MAITADDLAPTVARLKTRIGLERGPVSRTIEAGALIKFARGIGETNPLYLDEAYAKTTRFGALVAPPTYVSTFTADVLGGQLMDLDLPVTRFLHSDDAVEQASPILAGDVITAMARYADVYVRQGRNGPLLFQVAEMRLTRGSEPVATVRVASVSFE
ncbi:MAG: MaoC family dehydratase [Phenylobacterium sp.]|nr:MaoC family dehydratase [Phenylobacterium sp.]